MTGENLERDEATSLCILGDIPEILTIINPRCSEYQARDRSESVRVSLKLVFGDDVDEGKGLYGHLCVGVGDVETEWVRDKKKIVSRRIPLEHALSFRDMVNDAVSDEYTATDYIAATLLRYAVDTLTVGASITSDIDDLRVRISFAGNGYNIMDFDVTIPGCSMAKLLETKGDSISDLTEWDDKDIDI